MAVASEDAGATTLTLRGLVADVATVLTLVLYAPTPAFNGVWRYDATTAGGGRPLPYGTGEDKAAVLLEKYRVTVTDDGGEVTVSEWPVSVGWLNDPPVWQVEVELGEGGVLEVDEDVAVGVAVSDRP